MVVTNVSRHSRRSNTRFHSIKTNNGRYALAEQPGVSHANSFEVACCKATRKMSMVGARMRRTIHPNSSDANGDLVTKKSST
jgi:hypothetical protein